MDHVKPMLAQIICDSTRELGMIARPAMGISGIFIKKVTKLFIINVPIGYSVGWLLHNTSSAKGGRGQQNDDIK